MSEKPQIATGISVGKELLAKLGLSGEKVRRIVLDIPCDGAVTLTLEKFATAEEAEACGGAFDDWKLRQTQPESGVYQYVETREAILRRLAEKEKEPERKEPV